MLHPAGDQGVEIKPLPGYAVVNIGDSLGHLSGQKLKSCLHRVVPCTFVKAGDRFFRGGVYASGKGYDLRR